MSKKRKPRTIGEMTNSRGEWIMNPVTKIEKDKTKYDRKKNKLKKGDY